MTKSQQIKSMLLKTKNFFMDYTNFDKQSTGYGLTSDHSLLPERASIAATGFMFCALIIAHHYDQLTKDDLIEKANRTVDALLKMNHHHGFFPHFMSRHDGERFKKSEYSTIDTMLMIMGLIAIDSYINDPDFSKKAQILIDRIDWKSYLTTYQGKKVFAMSYNDLDQGDYVTGKTGYIYHWHMYAEQLMMYVLYPEDDALELYENVEKPIGTYKDISYVYTPGNTLFVYQFPLLFLNLKGYVDPNGFSIYKNAGHAIYGHIQLSEDLKQTFKTLSKDQFGFNASDTPLGYRVWHGLPNVNDRLQTDGTVAPFGMVCSLIWKPELYDAVMKLKTIPGLYGPYGFMDAFNMENGLWVSKKIISIDKGAEMLALDAISDHVIHDMVMKHPLIQQGLNRLKFRKEVDYGNN